MKKRMVSGITATGKLTLGNYLGAIKNLVQLQDKYMLFIFVADLHALTIDITQAQLAKNRKEIYALFIACGIDPNKTTLFFQSDVSEHSQMAWIMEGLSTTGELMRMTQFKDKMKQMREANGTIKSKTALLTYPTLMAGDILLYDAAKVPVGEDQKQHIELTRNIAERFNNRYGKTFNVPDFVAPNVGSKIMALQNPTKKMAKSDNNSKNSIFLLDDINVSLKKIQAAITDSEGKIYISNQKLGIKNLLTIFAGLTNVSLECAAKQFQNQNYQDLKLAIINNLAPLLEKIQANFSQAIKKVDHYAQIGARKAKLVAMPNLNKIYQKIGLGKEVKNQ